MKQILLLALVSYNLISCELKQDHVKPYIPGVYTSTWQTEFSNSNDTLIIEPLRGQGSEAFTITRKTLVSFNEKGRSKFPEYKIRKSVGVYDESTKTLVMENDGSILSFDPAKNKMSRGNTAYKKI